VLAGAGAFLWEQIEDAGDSLLKAWKARHAAKTAVSVAEQEARAAEHAARANAIRSGAIPPGAFVGATQAPNVTTPSEHIPTPVASVVGNEKLDAILDRLTTILEKQGTEGAKKTGKEEELNEVLLGVIQGQQQGSKAAEAVRKYEESMQAAEVVGGRCVRCGAERTLGTTCNYCGTASQYRRQATAPQSTSTETSANQFGPGFMDLDLSNRRNAGISEQDEIELTGADAKAKVRAMLLELEDPNLDPLKRDRLGKRINIALGYVIGHHPNEVSKTAVEKMVGEWVAFDNVYNKFDAIRDNDLEAGMNGVRAEFVDKYGGQEGEARWGRVLAEAAPVIVAMERDRRRLRKYITGQEKKTDPKVDEGEHTKIRNEIMEDLAREIKARNPTISDMEALGEARRGIKVWRLLGREALFNAFLDRKERGVKFNNPNFQDASLAKVIGGETKAHLFNTGTIDVNLRRYCDVLARDAISLNSKLEVNNVYRYIPQIRDVNQVTNYGLSVQKMIDWMDGISRCTKTLAATEAWVVDPKPETFLELKKVWTQGYKFGGFDRFEDLPSGAENPVYWLTDRRGRRVKIEGVARKMVEPKNLILAFLAKETMRVSMQKRRRGDPNQINSSTLDVRSMYLKMFPEAGNKNSNGEQVVVNAMADFVGDGLDVWGLSGKIRRQNFLGIKTRVK